MKRRLSLLLVLTAAWLLTCGFKEGATDLPSYGAVIACPYCHEDGINEIAWEVDVWYGYEDGAAEYTCLSCFHQFVSFNRKCYEKERFQRLMKQIGKTYPD